MTAETMEKKTDSKVDGQQCTNDKPYGFLSRFIFRCIRIILNFFGNGIFSLVFSFVKERKVPPATNPLLKESGVSLAEKIRTQKVTSEEVVKVFIERTKEVNPIVNALVDERFEDAIEEAKKADEFIRSGSMSVEEMKIQKPLLGVPVSFKEEIAVKGLSWTLGLVCRKDRKATEDAVILQNFRNSGAILIGVTNTPEFSCWVETTNFVYGHTCNPYNTNRSAGGSSGGEGALVSCCGSPIGIGTDFGGSVRIPAFSCGIYGHKPSGGLINTKGILFHDGTGQGILTTAGPLTRYAVDLKPCFAAILSPEKLPLLQLDLEVDIKKVKFHYLIDPKCNYISRVDGQIRDGFEKLVSIIADANVGGIPPQEANIPGLKNIVGIFVYWAFQENIDLASYLTDGKGRVNASTEFLKKIFGLSDHTLAALLMVINQNNGPPPESWSLEETEKLKKQLTKYLDDGGVLLLPGCATPAPYHYQSFTKPFDFFYYGMSNIFQLPATQVPIGVTRDGLPIGIQVIAAQNQDRLCFAVAEYIESLIGGWVPPFSFEIAS